MQVGGKIVLAHLEHGVGEWKDVSNSCGSDEAISMSLFDVRGWRMRT